MTDADLGIIIETLWSNRVLKDGFQKPQAPVRDRRSLQGSPRSHARSRKCRKVVGVGVGAVSVHFLVLALALPGRFPESSFTFVCLVILAFFCCRRDEATGHNQRTAQRSWTCWADRTHFNHGVSLQAVPFVLRLLRVVVHVLASTFRVSASASAALLHGQQRVRRQVDLLVVGSCERCFHLEMLAGKRVFSG